MDRRPSAACASPPTPTRPASSPPDCTQAAATGEALLDEELSSLARKDVGRFHSLNRRLQAQGAAGPSRRAAREGVATAAGLVVAWDRGERAGRAWGEVVAPSRACTPVGLLSSSAAGVSCPAGAAPRGCSPTSQ